MRVDVWSYYSVDRPPVKFHRIRRSFDAPTDNYSGSIVGVSVRRFWSSKTVAGLPSLFSSQPNPLPTAHLGLPNPPLDWIRRIAIGGSEAASNPQP